MSGEVEAVEVSTMQVTSKETSSTFSIFPCNNVVSLVVNCEYSTIYNIHIVLKVIITNMSEFKHPLISMVNNVNTNCPVVCRIYHFAMPMCFTILTRMNSPRH